MKYTLITPAWNEEKNLDALVDSVAGQTLPPARWIIVSDGSTDRTDEIVRFHCRRIPWLELLRVERTPVRNFAGKAHAVNAGYEVIKPMEFDLVGNLDADISLPNDYYEFLMSKFEENPGLGVAGTPFVEDIGKSGSHSYGHGLANLQHVSGACQLFRRCCFEEIGGYRPIKGGGIDWVAVTMARMRGWETRTFLERTCAHHRPMGTADRNRVRARFRHGQEDYWVGNHPLWQIGRGVFQMKNRPVVLGGLSLMLGYVFAWLSRAPCPIPEDLRAFHRREQADRIRRSLSVHAIR